MGRGPQVWLEELIDPSSNHSSPSQPPSSPSPPSSSPGGSSSSSSKGTVCSWSSGVTGLLRSSIEKQRQEAFQTRLRGERGWGELAARPCGGHRGRVHPRAEQGGGSGHSTLHARPESGGPCQGRGKLQCPLQEKIEAKLKFSQFLDEVTSNVLDRNRLRAFGRPVSPRSSTATRADLPEEKVHVVTEGSPGLAGSMAQQQASLLEQKKPREEQIPPDLTQTTYLETDIDTARANDEQQDPEVKADPPPQLDTDGENVIPPPPQFCQGFEMRRPFPESYFPRYPCRSASMPRGINMVPDEEMNNIDAISNDASMTITRMQHVNCEYRLLCEVNSLIKRTD
ncbi:hypothetical protein F2P81_024380 [Scophthalmus maximus]|uniref:Uncharacterized protein n=1 Tax=Scophthalmus maximus TaxID=52904 RepID=A0A6A4RWQ7_SCOMX|nr:hypothetical protein F2P81_024380 [Scophthalmus maximus]